MFSALENQEVSESFLQLLREIYRGLHAQMKTDIRGQ